MVPVTYLFPPVPPVTVCCKFDVRGTDGGIRELGNNPPGGVAFCHPALDSARRGIRVCSWLGLLHPRGDPSFGAVCKIFAICHTLAVHTLRKKPEPLQTRRRCKARTPAGFSRLSARICLLIDAGIRTRRVSELENVQIQRDQGRIPRRVWQPARKHIQIPTSGLKNSSPLYSVTHVSKRRMYDSSSYGECPPLR